MAEPFKMVIVKDKNGLVEEESTISSEKASDYISNVNIQGAPDGRFEYLRELLNSPIGTMPTAPNAPTAPTGNNLLDTLKKNTDTVSKSVNDIASVLHQSNVIGSRNVQAIENLGANIQSAIGAITQVINSGNVIKQVSNELFNKHSNVQTLKNYKEIDKLDFEAQGRPTLVDSQGNQIVPREAQATHNAEKALETKVGNSVNWGEVMDSVTTANNEINDEGINLFDQLVNIHKLDEATIKKIDDEVKKINWGDTNGE